MEFQGQILVAEDNPSNQMLIGLLLKKLGFETTIAEDGQIALDKFPDKPFRVILMDMMMPNMNGYESTRAFRKMGVDIPIIAVTANAMSGDREKCLEAGCDEYITKPINKDKLEQVLAKFLEPTDDSADNSDSQQSAGSGDNGPIISELAEDEDLCIVADMFVEKLNETVERIQTSFENSEMDVLKDVVHEIKGAGGSAGYPILTEKAAFLEALIKEDKLDQVRDSIEEFVSICKRVEAPNAVNAVG